MKPYRHLGAKIPEDREESFMVVDEEPRERGFDFGMVFPGVPGGLGGDRSAIAACQFAKGRRRLELSIFQSLEELICDGMPA
jgi:hypothetical protein